MAPRIPVSEQWLEPAARGIHDQMCGCNGPEHFRYYLAALYRDRAEIERLREALRLIATREYRVCMQPHLIAREALESSGTSERQWGCS